MKENHFWILVGISIGLLIYLGDKYILKIMFPEKFPDKIFP